MFYVGVDRDGWEGLFIPGWFGSDDFFPSIPIKTEMQTIYCYELDLVTSSSGIRGLLLKTLYVKLYEWKNL